MKEQVLDDEPQTKDALRDLVMEVLHRHTEYAPGDFDDDSDFENDMGVDSIAIASVQAEVYRSLGLKNTAAQAGLDSVRQLLQHTRQRLQNEGLDEHPTSLPEVTEEITSNPTAVPGPDTLRTSILDIYQAHTGYLHSELDLHADLESDLGIDSVTQATVLSDVRKLIKMEDLTFPAGLKSIDQVISYLSDMGVATIPGPASTNATTNQTQSSADNENQQNSEAMWESFIKKLNRDSESPRKGADTEPADDFNLSFSANGIGRKEVLALHEHLRDQHNMPSNLRLSDCDTSEKLLRYIKASGPHQLETLGVDSEPRSYETSQPEEEDSRTMQDFVNLPDRDLFHKTREFRKFYIEKQKAQLYWYGMPLESQCRNRAVIYDEVTGRRREFLMFASNNYLGLANHPHVIEAITDGARRYGATNTGCRLIGGSNVLHKELEHRLAKLKGRESCIVYPSGYSANLGCISALAGRGDLVFTDSINHMSIQDGCKLSGASRKIYQHDMDSLESTLKKYADHDGGKLIVTDGVFSMHGDIVDLPRLVDLAQQYGARVLVDDAHSTGVLGKTGSGTTEHFGMKGEADLELGTMSKALAGVGGFVCASEEVVEYLRFYSNSYVFAATIPASVAAGVIASIDVMENEPQRLSQLWSNIHRLRGHLLGAGFNLEQSDSAIIPVVVGDDQKTLEFGRAVRARGMYCQTVVFPGVAVGDARLRISVSSEHTGEDLDLAAQVVIDAAKEVNIPVNV